MYIKRDHIVPVRVPKGTAKTFEQYATAYGQHLALGGLPAQVNKISLTMPDSIAGTGGKAWKKLWAI